MELSREEEARQLSELTKLRTRHHELLVRSGIARRIIDAEVPINYLSHKAEITEATLVYPTRQWLPGTAIGILWGTRESFSGSSLRLPQSITKWLEFIKRYTRSDSIMLSRVDALQCREGYSVNAFDIGVQLDRQDPQAAAI